MNTGFSPAAIVCQPCIASAAKLNLCPCKGPKERAAFHVGAASAQKGHSKCHH